MPDGGDSVLADYMREYRKSKEYVDLECIASYKLKRALEMFVAAAIEKQVSAAYGGSSTDGGGRRLLEMVHSYVMGYKQKEPYWLLDTLLQVEHEADPEYITYQRLKEKFA